MSTIVFPRPLLSFPLKLSTYCPQLNFGLTPLQSTGSSPLLDWSRKSLRWFALVLKLFCSAGCKVGLLICWRRFFTPAHFLFLYKARIRRTLEYCSQCMELSLPNRVQWGAFWLITDPSINSNQPSFPYRRLIAVLPFFHHHRFDFCFFWIHFVNFPVRDFFSFFSFSDMAVILVKSLFPGIEISYFSLLFPGLKSSGTLFLFPSKNPKCFCFQSRVNNLNFTWILSIRIPPMQHIVWL